MSNVISSCSSRAIVPFSTNDRFRRFKRCGNRFEFVSSNCPNHASAAERGSPHAPTRSPSGTKPGDSSDQGHRLGAAPLFSARWHITLCHPAFSAPHCTLRSPAAPDQKGACLAVRRAQSGPAVRASSAQSAARCQVCVVEQDRLVHLKRKPPRLRRAQPCKYAAPSRATLLFTFA